MQGIPGVLYREIRAILLDCGPFGNDQRAVLRAIFSDPRLRPWRHNIPEGPDELVRVEALITLLYEKPFDKPNPLLRFMRILSERMEGTGCQIQLDQCARQLAGNLGETIGTGRVVRDLKPLQEALVEAFTVSELERMVRLEMGIDLESIAGAGSKQDIVFDLVRWADRRDRLPELVLAARRQNDGNLALQEVAANFPVR